jgi:hypothetical protein
MAKSSLEEGDGITETAPSQQKIAGVCIEAARRILEIVKELRQQDILGIC